MPEKSRPVNTDNPILALWRYFQIRNQRNWSETDSLRVELDTERKIRTRNKLYYRFNHWPIWIFVFFIAPGPLTFDLFERGFDARLIAWLSIVVIGTGVAGLFGKLPG